MRRISRLKDHMIASNPLTSSKEIRCTLMSKSCIAQTNSLIILEKVVTNKMQILHRRAQLLCLRLILATLNSMKPLTER